MKIRPVGAELFHVDRRTDKTKLIVAFRNFTKASKNAVFAPVCGTGTQIIYIPTVKRAKDLPDIITRFLSGLMLNGIVFHIRIICN
jgi:hypothetical protein